MRLLVVAPFLPSPAATHGGGVVLGTLLAALAQQAEVDLLALVTRRELAAAPPRPAGLGRVSLVVRREKRDFRGLGALRDRLRHAARLAGGTPLLVSKFRSNVLSEVLRRTVRDRRPDACLLEMAWMAQYLPACTGVPTILTDHEAGMPAAGAEGPGAGRDRRAWPGYVARTYRLADRLQALNAEDAASLASRLDRPVAVRPAAVPWPAVPATPAESPPRLLFLGDYRHPPNPEAARFVATAVLPRIRTAVPEAELRIAGPHAEEAGLGAVANLPGVRLVGRVDDLGASLRDVRALIAPVFQGGGSRIKVLTALAHGLPVAANALGLRGVDAGPPAVECADDAEGLASACITWLRDAEAARRAGEAARRWAREHASPEAAARIQLAVVADLLLTGRR